MFEVAQKMSLESQDAGLGVHKEVQKSIAITVLSIELASRNKTEKEIEKRMHTF